VGSCKGNLEDAQAALDNVKSRKRRGERVAPTRVTFGDREAAFGKGMAKPTDYVFASEAGTPLHYRNVVRRGLDKAAEDGGLIESAAKRKPSESGRARGFAAALPRLAAHVRVLADRSRLERGVRIAAAARDVTLRFDERDRDCEGANLGFSMPDSRRLRPCL
jgi:hypothetical protein